MDKRSAQYRQDKKALLQMLESAVQFDADGSCTNLDILASQAVMLTQDYHQARVMASQAVRRARYRQQVDGSPGRPPQYDEPMIVTPVHLRQDQREWLSAQPGGIAETVRRLVDAAME